MSYLGFMRAIMICCFVTKQSKVVRWKDFEEKYSPGLFLVPSALSEKDQCTLECQINEGGVPNKRVGPTTFEN